jgi:FMN phosphatase YigB (HAD superfamily)
MNKDNVIINPSYFMNNIDNVFFDLDETLIHTNEANNSAYHYASSLLGVSLIPRTRITRSDLSFGQETNNKLIALKNLHYEKFLKLTHINKRYFELLRKYNKSNKCYIISAGQKNRVMALVKFHQLDIYFKGFYTSIDDKIGYIKDHFTGMSILFDRDL